MTFINPTPSPYPPPFFALILFPIKPEKDESLKSWLDRKNNQREYYSKINNPEHIGTTRKFIISKGTKAIFNNKDFGVLCVESKEH